MNRALPLLLLLAACVPGGTEPIWLKPGASALAAEQDYLACAAQARRDFPADRRIAVAPRVTIGIGRCRGNFCFGGTDNFGGFGGADVYERDANAGLRERALNLCMAQKGYGERRLPVCTARTTSPLQSQPFDTTGLCIRNGRISVPR